MRKFLSSLFLVACCLISSCENMSEKDIEETASKGVVLVQNQSYYEVVLSNGESLFFSGFDEDGDITGVVFDKDSVELTTSYGTGFLISQEGEIATNYHVVSRTMADKDVNKSVGKVISALKIIVKEIYNDYSQKLEYAQEAYDYANWSQDVSYEDFYKIQDIRNTLNKEVQEYAEIYNALDDIRASESEIKYHNQVSIAFNNTFVTNTSDFISCVVTKQDQEHDLAIIQLKDKKTPADKYVFQVEENDPLDTYSWRENIEKEFKEDKNSKLFMLSFNLGPSLALTQEGIKSQFNSGNISQKTHLKIMYSIPALPGSSGSPVLNQKGQLVSINFAGINGTQNFNYGIRVKYLKELIEK